MIFMETLLNIIQNLLNFIYLVLDQIYFGYLLDHMIIS